MKKEKNYDFRVRLDQVHKPDILDDNTVRHQGEISVDAGWAIAPAADAGQLVQSAAEDLRDYFLISMKLPLKITPGGNSGIVLELMPELPSPGSFRISVESGRITIAGRDPRGVRFGCIRLEDIFNLRGAPFIEKSSWLSERQITPRLVHSGRGIEDYPDEHLNAILHAGFDGIVIFIRDIDRTNVGYMDINAVIERAEKFGLSTILFSYLPSFKHPDDPDAEAFFDNIYGRIFRHYPKAGGLMMSPESSEFPSRDPASTGKTWRESTVDGISDPRPSPGWWPCEDYPRWLKRVRDAVRKVNPEALIIFNTYNWGWAPEADRRRFLEALPEDIIIQITFELFEEIRREGVICRIMDYSISADKPGFYFTSEAKNAWELGIPLLATSNTAGMTWDFGCIPYVPVPQQWIRRFKVLDYARRQWGVSRYYENHHYGWWPSVITELAKWYFQSPQADIDNLLRQLAERRSGGRASSHLLRAWDLWSEAIGYYVPSNEDQYGPFRVGPAYPLIFHPNITRTMSGKEIAFPTAPEAHFGNSIIKTMYQPFENAGQTPGAIRCPVELKSLHRMLKLWRRGIAAMEKALALTPEPRRGEIETELNLGRFIANCIITGINTKKWWILNTALTTSNSVEKSLRLLNEIETLAIKEIENALATIPLVEVDSRLGWEPSMEYVCDRWHLEWKVKQVRTMLDGEVSVYRTMLNLK
jgi:hypothetical protein